LNQIQALLVSHYGSLLGSQLFKKLSKYFTRIYDGHSKDLDFDDYVDLTQNLLNRSEDFRTRLFFQVIDFNSDRHVCEWDLFRVMQEMLSQKEIPVDKKKQQGLKSSDLL